MNRHSILIVDYSNLIERLRIYHRDIFSYKKKICLINKKNLFRVKMKFDVGNRTGGVPYWAGV
jgi:hypothetical protein